LHDMKRKRKQNIDNPRKKKKINDSIKKKRRKSRKEVAQFLAESDSDSEKEIEVDKKANKELDELNALFAEVEKGEDKKKKKKSDELEEPPDDDLGFVEFRNGRKHVDGLPIYSLGELKVGQGGDTELCPFDCECCF